MIRWYRDTVVDLCIIGSVTKAMMEIFFFKFDSMYLDKTSPDVVADSFAQFLLVIFPTYVRVTRHRRYTSYIHD